MKQTIKFDFMRFPYKIQDREAIWQDHNWITCNLILTVIAVWNKDGQQNWAQGISFAILFVRN